MTLPSPPKTPRSSEPSPTDPLQARLQEQRDNAGYGDDDASVRMVAVATLPTRFGNFRLVGFSNDRDDKDHVALVHGDVVNASEVPIRLHSECLTGDALGSLRCDCRDQLEHALKLLSQYERGCLLYLRQEGRGIGLLNKVRAYELQDAGLDTVEANRALGFEDDERDYTVAADMLNALGVDSVRVMTNNPDKMAQLERHGVEVAGRIPHQMKPNAHNQFYLETKVARSGHMMELEPSAKAG